MYTERRIDLSIEIKKYGYGESRWTTENGVHDYVLLVLLLNYLLILFVWFPHFYDFEYAKCLCKTHISIHLQRTSPMKIIAFIFTSLSHLDCES